MTDEPERKASTRARGRASERRAASYLDGQGLAIVAMNVEIAGAELDLIAREPDGTLVFVEVRSRSDTARGHPFETIDSRKRARVRRAATAWLVREQLWEQVAVRFDAVALVGERLEWLRDAF